VFRPGPDALLVTLALRPAASWVADYHPCESVQEGSDGGLVVRMRVADPAWARRLALRLGPHGRVLSPAALAEDVRAEAAAALAAYEA
jgi:proteasome accessory factor C